MIKRRRIKTKLTRMGRKIATFLHFINFAALLLCSDIEATAEPINLSVSISTRQMDITTPITTFPAATLTDPETPTIMNPANPIMTPLATNTPAGSWCVARQFASQAALQAALDYACSDKGGVDCIAIGPDGPCYEPNTIRDHASYAFNVYYQKNPTPTSCNFGGTAIATTTDPSFGTCQYASTSTSSSVLNISNSSGSRVFGAGRPITPFTSAASMPIVIPYFHYIIVPLVIYRAVPRYNPNV